MALKNYAKFGLFLLLACFTLGVAAQDYPVNFDKDNAVLGRTDRYVRSLSIGDQTIAIWNSVTSSTPVYVDKTAESFTVKAGEEVTLSMDWYAAGAWMHTYAYVDWDRDGQFKVDDVSDEGLIGEGQDIVTFSFWSPTGATSGYNSAGEEVGEGPGTVAMPAFTIPADAEGEYRLRFKLDWNNLDPGGCPSGNNLFVKEDGTSSNAGTIIDVTLVVENEKPAAVETFKAYCARGYFNGGEDSDAALKGLTLDQADAAAEFALIDYDGTTYLYDATHKTFICHSEENVTNLGLSGNALLSKSSDFSKIVRGVQLLEDTGFDAYPFHFEDENGNYLNMDGGRNLYFNKWVDYEGGAGGNTYAIQTVGELDPTEAIALLDAYFRPDASYSIVIFDRETEKEYTVAEGLPAQVGDVISQLPEAYQKAFCTYEVVEPLTVENGSDNVLLVDVTFHLPFTEGKWYNMTVRSQYAVYDETVPVNCTTTAPDASEKGAAWGFKGNPYEGVRIVNYLAGDGFSLGCDELIVARPGADVYMKAGDFRWVLDTNANGIVFRHPEDLSVYLHNRTPNLATCSLSEWWDVHEDAGSTVAITEVTIKEEVSDLVDVFFSIGNADAEADDWYFGSLKVENGMVLSELPEELQKPFTTYTYRESITVDKEAFNQFYAFGSFAPFKTSINKQTFLYNIKTASGRFFHATADGALEAVEATPAADDASFQFTFTGNPYEGFVAKNVQTGTSISLPTLAAEGVVATLAATGTKLGVADVDGNFQFTVAAGEVVAALGDGAQSEGAYEATAVCALPAYAAGAESASLSFVEPGSEAPVLDKNLQPTTRVETLETGKQYLIYDTALASGDQADRYGFVYADETNIHSYGLSVPTTFVTNKNYAYVWTLEDAGEGKYYIKNLGTGLYAGLGTSMSAEPVAFTIGKFADAPSKGSADSRNDDGTRLAVSDITADMPLYYISNDVDERPYWNGNNAPSEGYDMFAMWSKAHPYTFYDVEEATVKVTFNVKDAEGNVLASEVVGVVEGATVSELPESLKRDFTEYAYDEAFTAAADGLKEFNAVATFNLPFTVSNDEETFYHYFVINNKYYRVVASGAQAHVGGQGGGFTVVPFTLDEILSFDEETQEYYHWAFYGNPYEGIKIFNQGQWQYAKQNGSDMAFGDFDEAVSYQIAAQGEGFILTYDGATMRDVYDILALRTSGNTEANTTITTPKYEEPQPEEVEYTISVVDGEGVVYETLTAKALDGDVISQVPEDLYRPFCEYAVAEPLHVSATAEENVLFVEVTFQQAPFVSTLEEPVYQTIRYTDEDDDTAIIGGAAAGDEWYVIAYTDDDETASSPETQWVITGNPYAYKFYNRGAELYISGHFASDEAQLTSFVLEAEPVTFAIDEEEDGLFGFHAWFQYGFYPMLLNEPYASAMVPSLISITAAPTGINTVKVGEDAAATYDLQGRRVSTKANKAGLYIVNGKKVLVK